MNSAFVTTGITLLSSSKIAASILPSNGELEGYNPYAEETTDLREFTWFGEHLKVNGKVLGKDGITGVSDAIIEVWHLSPDGKKYRHRAKLRSGSSGVIRSPR